MGSRRASAVSHNERYRVRRDCDKRYKRGVGLVPFVPLVSQSCGTGKIQQRQRPGGFCPSCTTVYKEIFELGRKTPPRPA
nr:MAG TPA: hypothetical protein [Caudoviricetes sp.]